MPSTEITEVLPGLHWWTTEHEELHAPVSSYYVEPAGVLIDPRVPEAGTEALAELGTPQQIVLTTGLHLRHAEELAKAFGCPIRAVREALGRLGDDAPVEAFTAGDEVAPGVRSIEVDVLAPDEIALHVAVAEGAISFADALHHYGDTLGFFPDSLLGDDPQKVKDGLTNRLRAVLERDFDHLLFAHGDPIIGKGKAALRAFVEAQDQR